ncbi:hypothetical protein SJPD1_1054 [Sulfurospirillum diekertiae]|uniref:Uncharacterized protein n=1 Tax=Sulfurospirillum diekertiae TaxID=1854492 RepID=A0A290HTL3_9BACT|nr:hypothetical protein [Sulfurospirillum diekertiae]ATB69166.1 hypothetical protein SJPD1_1054 [Sulfurospirillum diekertiae]
MYAPTNAVLSIAPINTSFTLFDGTTVDVSLGDLVFFIQGQNTETNNLEYLDFVVVSFVDNIFNYSKTILGSNFQVFLSSDRNSFIFTSGENFQYVDFVIDASAMSKLPSSPHITGGVTSNGFSVPDLDGNFGAYPNGTVVTVSARKGEYVVEASQQLWSYPAVDLQGSSVIYKLSQNGKILLAPHFLLTLKDS